MGDRLDMILRKMARKGVSVFVLVCIHFSLTVYFVFLDTGIANDVSKVSTFEVTFKGNCII